MAETLLTVADLKVTSDAGDGFTLGPVNFSIAGQEVLGLVGDSGSGKSLLIAALTASLRASAHVDSGQVSFDGIDLLGKDARVARGMRGRRIAFIGSNPHGLLHPLLPVGRQVANILRAHEKVSRNEARSRVLDMFGSVGIPDPERRLDAYPHELSGGMAQRVVVAMGLICDPEVILADEPTAGLDVTIQAQVLDLIERMVRERGDRALLLATRDLGIVARFCDRVAILEYGRLVEQRRTVEFFDSPLTDSSADLIRASRGF